MSKAINLEQLKLLAQKNKAEADKLAADIAEYSVVKQETAESGFIATYQLTKDGAAVGEKINVPKDFLVKSASIETVETADQPYAGAAVGDKYIDFVINAKDGDANAEHIYLAVDELVNIYTGGDGVTIAGNAVSVKIDGANANGLTVGANGLALAAATTATAGAMSAEDKTKLDALTFATDDEVNAMLTDVFGS